MTILKVLTFSKTGLNKLKIHQRELKSSDVENSMKPIPPGEWCLFTHPTLQAFWLGYVNPLIDDKFSSIQLLEQINHDEMKTLSAEGFITSKISKAILKRSMFKDYDKGSRLFYGQNDGLPGLIIDSFHDVAIIQINTAGIDRYRDQIKAVVDKKILGTAIFLDNPKYREKELLPSFEATTVPPLDIEENGIKYKIRPEVLQKIGFYYDHRENRRELASLVSRLKKIPEQGLDLFCYAGAWGLNLLKAGVSHIEFVDQGDFGVEIHENLKINGLNDKGSFSRGDVFKYLDEKILIQKKFDIVLCDPPAFAKSHLQKSQALDGYTKLHRKVFKVANPGSILAFSSCTHYVSHEEFQKNILDSAYKEEKKIQLLHTGMQGWDHPVSSLDDKSNYIKCYIYLME